MFSIASSKTGDRAGLAHSRRSYLASVVVDLIHHSRPREGGGRLGNYLVLSDPESGKCILLARGPVGRTRAIERVLCFKNQSPLGSWWSQARRFQIVKRWRLTFGP